MCTRSPLSQQQIWEVTVEQDLQRQHHQTRQHHWRAPVAFVNLASSVYEADLTSCQQLQNWYYNGNLVYNDNVVLLVLPAITIVCGTGNSKAPTVTHGPILVVMQKAIDL